MREKLGQFLKKLARRSAEEAMENEAAPNMNVPTTQVVEAAPEADETAAAVEQVIARLHELKYLNDAAFAKDYIHDRMSFKPRGKFLLKRELKQKGLDEESISSALASTEIDEVKMAISVLEKNSKKLASLSGHERKSKAFRLLASRGFNPDAIYKAFNSCYTDIER